MKRIAGFAEGIALFMAYLQSRPLRWYLLLLVVVATGPFGADFVFLVDLVTAVGVDVFILAMLYYFSGGLSEVYRASIDRIARVLAGQGVVLREECLASPSSLALCLSHNFFILVTPVRFVTIALLCFGGAAAMPWLGVQRVA